MKEHGFFAGTAVAERLQILQPHQPLCRPISATAATALQPCQESSEDFSSLIHTKRVILFFPYQWQVETTSSS